MDMILQILVEFPR